MRRAYGGRAAAYERRGDHDRAAADYGMIVFSYAVELDLADPKGDGYPDLLRDAAKAYRTRAACLEAKGDKEAAGRDRRRADKLEAKAKDASEKTTAAAPAAPAPPAPLSAHVTLRNDWGDALTVVIAGVSYTLRTGESKTVPCPTGSFSYEMRAGPYVVKGTLDSGHSYRLAANDSPSP